MKLSAWPYTYSLITLVLIAHVYITMSHYGNLFLEQRGDLQITEKAGESVTEPDAAFRARRNTQIAVSLVRANIGLDLVVFVLMSASAIFRRRDILSKAREGEGTAKS